MQKVTGLAVGRLGKVKGHVLCLSELLLLRGTGSGDSEVPKLALLTDLVAKCCQWVTVFFSRLWFMYLEDSKGIRAASEILVNSIY